MNNKIIDFLIEAKKNTYAGKGSETTSSRLFSHDLKYEKDNLLYYDSYLGNDNFSGTEALWFDNKPIWSMNYIGRVLDKENFSGDFLKEALLCVSRDYPYRGPYYYQNGDFEYKMMVDGKFDFFTGKEVILYKSKIIYECNFHGGIVSDKLL